MLPFCLNLRRTQAPEYWNFLQDENSDFCLPTVSIDTLGTNIPFAVIVIECFTGLNVKPHDSSKKYGSTLST